MHMHMRVELITFVVAKCFLRLKERKDEKLCIVCMHEDENKRRNIKRSKKKELISVSNFENT